MSSGARVSPLRTEGASLQLLSQPFFCADSSKIARPDPSWASSSSAGRAWTGLETWEGFGGRRWLQPTLALARPWFGVWGSLPVHLQASIPQWGCSWGRPQAPAPLPPGQHQGSPKCPTWHSLSPPAPTLLLGTSGAFPTGPDETKGAKIPERGRNQGLGGSRNAEQGCGVAGAELSPEAAAGSGIRGGSQGSCGPALVFWFGAGTRREQSPAGSHRAALFCTQQRPVAQPGSAPKVPASPQDRGHLETPRGPSGIPRDPRGYPRDTWGHTGTPRGHPAVGTALTRGLVVQQELHLQPLPALLSQRQGDRALGVPGGARHRRPAEDQGLGLGQVAGGDGRTEGLRQSRGDRG